MPRPSRKETHVSKQSPNPPVKANSNVLYTCAGTEQLLKRVERLAPQVGPVLIEGESGTGKTVLAEAFHRLSDRREQPFLDIGCGEIHSGTFEAQLFGHTGDAFTGAGTEKKGLLAATDRGTLVLNDIDQLSPQLQAKLLRFLDDGCFLRMGQTGIVSGIDTRIIVTSNKNLQESSKTGLFLPDLFYRLKRWRLKIPPLRKRVSDIPLFAAYFLQQFHKEKGQEPPQTHFFSPEVNELLATLLWPDNLRGLRSAVENIAVFGAPSQNGFELQTAVDVLFDPDYGFRESVPDKNHPSFLTHILEMTGNNIKMTSKITGLSRTTIYKRMNQKP